MRIDCVTDEEKKLGIEDKLVCGTQATVDRSWSTPSYDRFGNPFFVAVFRDDTVKETREKIIKNLKLEEAEFTFWIGDWANPDTEIKDKDDVPILSLLTDTLNQVYLVYEKSKTKDKKAAVTSYYRKERSIKIDN